MVTKAQDKNTAIIAKARELKKNGDLDLAVNQYRLLLKKKPNDPIALINLANIYESKSDWEKVIKICYRIIAVRPNQVNARLKLARALYEQKNFYSAMGELQAVQSIDINSLKFRDYKLLQQVIVALSDRKQTKIQQELLIVSIRKQLELKPKRLALYLQLADVLVDQKNYTEAINVYQEGIDLMPKSSFLAYLRLAKAQEKQGLLDDAISSYEKATQVKPEQAQSYFLLAKAYQFKGWFNEALSYCQKAIELNHPKSKNVYKLMGDMLKEQGKLEDAEMYYKNA